MHIWLATSRFCRTDPNVQEACSFFKTSEWVPRASLLFNVTGPDIPRNRLQWICSSHESKRDEENRHNRFYSDVKGQRVDG